MAELTKHWTSESTDSYLYSIASHFVLQLECAMGKSGISQSVLAKLLKLSESRVSQVFNNPGNLTLRKMIEYSGAVGAKIAVVVYNDDDPCNEKGLVNGEIFARCWEMAGKPVDFFDLREVTNFAVNSTRSMPLILGYTSDLRPQLFPGTAATINGGDAPKIKPSVSNSVSSAALASN